MEINAIAQIIDIISSPDVAFILLMLGILGVSLEIATPGSIVPGVIGGISLIVAFFAFQTLPPVSYIGAALILLALALLIAEIKLTSHGELAAGGAIAMLFGSMMLFEPSASSQSVSWSVILVTVFVTTGFFVIVLGKVVSAHRQAPATGQEGLIGEIGVAMTAIAPHGKVFVRGEYWDAFSDDSIDVSGQIVVESVKGMQLKVKKTA